MPASNDPNNSDIRTVASVWDLPPVLRVSSVARLMRVNRKTVYEMVRTKSIPGVVRMGTALRFSRDALLQWLGVRRLGK
jgi:excisionase family DNA binding protein